MSRVPVAADDIRTSYNAGLDVWGSCVHGPGSVELLRERLEGHVGLLFLEVEELAPQMRGSHRIIGVNLLVRAYQLLTEGAGEGAAEACYVQDLAVVARSLLGLWERPGELGEPTGVAAISAAITARRCGACGLTIRDGEPYRRRVFASDSTGGIRGYQHAGQCVPAQGGPALVPVSPAGLTP